MSDRNHLWSHLALGFSSLKGFYYCFYSLLIIGVFRFPVSSWLSLGRLFLGIYPTLCHPFFPYDHSSLLKPLYFDGISFNISFHYNFNFEVLFFFFLVSLGKDFSILFLSKKLFIVYSSFLFFCSLLLLWSCNPSSANFFVFLFLIPWGVKLCLCKIFIFFKIGIYHYKYFF